MIWRTRCRWPGSYGSKGERFMAHSVEEVCRKLRLYIEGEEQIDECYRGEVKKNREALSALNADEDTRAADRSVAGEGQVSTVAGAVGEGTAGAVGAAVRQSRIRGGSACRRIRLHASSTGSSRRIASRLSGSGMNARSIGVNRQLKHPRMWKAPVVFEEIWEESAVSQSTGIASSLASVVVIAMSEATLSTLATVLAERAPQTRIHYFRIYENDTSVSERGLLADLQQDASRRGAVLLRVG